ncbi:MAG: universal stress protein [Bacteroidota bacterium]
MSEININLVGVGSRQYQLLKCNLEVALQQLALPLYLCEITDIDWMLQYQVPNIPAVFFRNQILFDGTSTPTIETLIQTIYKHYYTTMRHDYATKKILVPVDFSDTSLSALLFAGELAARSDTTIDLVHIYGANFQLHEDISFELMKTKEKEILYQLEKFKHITPTHGSVQVLTKVQSKAILAYNVAAKLSSISKDYDFVVMGMTGTHALGKKHFGSIASYVAQNAECPVLLIPRAHQIKSLRKIVYAQNWIDNKDATLRHFLQFAASFHSNVYFTHINEAFDVQGFPSAEQLELQAKISEINPKIECRFVNLNSDDVRQGIEDYARQQEADLIVLVNQHRGRLNNVLGRSLTKEMALEANLPLMIYHE